MRLTKTKRARERETERERDRERERQREIRRENYYHILLTSSESLRLINL